MRVLVDQSIGQSVFAVEALVGQPVGAGLVAGALVIVVIALGRVAVFIIMVIAIFAVLVLVVLVT
jgi:hypothetical protein